MSDCIFCKIASGELESDLLAEDDRAVAFNDLNPQAPSHILIIPKKHIDGLSDAGDGDEGLLGHLLLMARKVARERNLGPAFRVVVNNGAQAGQSVFHLHVHLLSGRSFQWPPG